MLLLSVVSCSRSRSWPSSGGRLPAPGARKRASGHMPKERTRSQENASVLVVIQGREMRSTKEETRAREPQKDESSQPAYLGRPFQQHNLNILAHGFVELTSATQRGLVVPETQEASAHSCERRDKQQYLAHQGVYATVKMSTVFDGKGSYVARCERRPSQRERRVKCTHNTSFCGSAVSSRFVFNVYQSAKG